MTVGFEQASCQRFFDLLFIVNEKEKSASLREGGGFCEAKDGRSLRDGGFEQASCQRFFDLLFIVNEKEKGGIFRKQYGL